MDAAPSLRVISKHGSGTDTIDKVAAAGTRHRGRRRRRRQCRGGGRAGAGADAGLRQVRRDARTRACTPGHWDKATHKSVELEGRTVGVIGLGAIGLRFARMADALGMRVLGFDPFAKDSAGRTSRAADLETIWRESDAISLHCPLTDDNASWSTPQTLAACKTGVILVNTARGGLIDEAALLEAVRSGQVAQRGSRQLRRRADDDAASRSMAKRASR